jgi:hypothetical protein
MSATSSFMPSAMVGGNQYSATSDMSATSSFMPSAMIGGNQYSATSDMSATSSFMPSAMVGGKSKKPKKNVKKQKGGKINLIDILDTNTSADISSQFNSEDMNNIINTDNIFPKNN